MKQSLFVKCFLGTLLQVALAQSAFAGKIFADRMFAFADQTLYAGDRLYSADTRFFLEMQTDCNLVIYRSKNIGQVVPIWNTMTQGKGSNCRMSMQTDGNMVVYDNNNIAVFDTKTPNNTNAVLVMQADGNLVIYSNFKLTQPIWNAGSQQPK